MDKDTLAQPQQLKKFTIRDVDTVKTTAAFYPIFLCVLRPPVPV